MTHIQKNRPRKQLRGWACRLVLLLKQFIRTKSIIFNTEGEYPNARTRKLLKKAEEDYRKGNTSPAFDNAEDAIKYLEDQGI